MLKKVLNTLLSKIIVAFSNLGVAVLISQELGAEAKGETSILLTNIALVLLFANVFSGGTLAYLISKFNPNKIFIVSVFSACVISAISFCVFYSLASSFYLAINCALLSFIATITSAFQNFLLGLNKTNYYNLTVVSQSLVLLCVISIGLFFYKSNVIIYTIGLYVSFVFSLLLSFVLYYFSSRKKELSKENVSFKTLVQIGIQNQLSQVFYMFLMRASYYFLLLKSGKFDVGVFSNALILAEGIWLISNSLSTVLYAQIINSTKEEAIKLTLFFCRLSFVLSFMGLLIFWILPNSFYTFIFGADFYEVKKIIIWLSPGIVLYSFSIIIVHYFSGLGRFKVSTISNFTGLVVAGISLFFLMDNFNIKSAVIFQSISYVVITCFLVVLFLKESAFNVSAVFFSMNDITLLRKYFKSMTKKN